MNATQFIKYAATFAGGAYAQHKLAQQQVFRDPGFLSILDAALQDVEEDDIEQLVNLSPNRLRDWAMAPKVMRPALLKKWVSEPEESLAEQVARSFNELADKIPERKEISPGFWKTSFREHPVLTWILVATTVFGVVTISIAQYRVDHQYESCDRQHNFVTRWLRGAPCN